MGGDSLVGDDSLIGFGDFWIWLHAVNRSMSLGLALFFICPVAGLSRLNWYSRVWSGQGKIRCETRQANSLSIQYAVRRELTRISDDD